MLPQESFQKNLLEPILYIVNGSWRWWCYRMLLRSKVSLDAATPNTNIKITILDKSKRRIYLQVKLEQSDTFFKTTNDLTKQEGARKVLAKVNVTYDSDVMVVNSFVFWSSIFAQWNFGSSKLNCCFIHYDHVELLSMIRLSSIIVIFSLKM